MAAALPPIRPAPPPIKIGGSVLPQPGEVVWLKPVGRDEIHARFISFQVDDRFFSAIDPANVATTGLYDHYVHDSHAFDELYAAGPRAGQTATTRALRWPVFGFPVHPVAALIQQWLAEAEQVAVDEGYGPQIGIVAAAPASVVPLAVGGGPPLAGAAAAGGGGFNTTVPPGMNLVCLEVFGALIPGAILVPNRVVHIAGDRALVELDVNGTATVVAARLLSDPDIPDFVKLLTDHFENANGDAVGRGGVVTPRGATGVGSARVMELHFDLLGKRHRQFRDKVLMLTTTLWDGFSVRGPRTFVWVCRYIVDNGGTPLAMHNNWKHLAKLQASDAGVTVHESMCRAIEIGLCWDQCNG